MKNRGFNMYTNLLKAITNIKNLGEYDFDEIYSKNLENISSNPIQSTCGNLETFVKDSFSNSFYESDKLKFHSKYFSYSGNANNPPDSMLKNGDAIEVKKMISDFRQVQLNSSFPKNKLYSNDPLLNRSCVECEDWSKKDMLYAFGIVKNNTQLQSLSFIYGDCFAADEEVYLKVKHNLTETIRDIPNSKSTNELGRINNVDPLGITNLRVRGMWILKNPYKIFEDIFHYDSMDDFNLFCLMPEYKFNSFPKHDRNSILGDDEIICEEVKLIDPNNTINQINSVFIRYDING